MALYKRVKKAVKKAYKKRYVKKGKTNYNKIAKDVMYLKSVLNPEKKRHSGQVTDQLIGQVNIDSNATYSTDITPSPAQGITSITRNGNSIKLHSTHFKYQIQAQSNLNGSPIKFKIFIIKVIGTPIASNLIPSRMFSPNTFITLSGVNAGIIDFNSDRREDTFKQFIILRSKNVYLSPNNHNGQIMHKTGSIGLKYKSHHIKFTSDGTSTISDGQLIMLVMADNGNVGNANSTLSGTSTISANSGALLNWDMTHWFYDN